MTDPTDDQVKALLDEMTFAMFGDGTDDTISEKLARALLASEAARKLAEERLATDGVDMAVSLEMHRRKEKERHK